MIDQACLAARCEKLDSLSQPGAEHTGLKLRNAGADLSEVVELPLKVVDSRRLGLGDALEVVDPHALMQDLAHGGTRPLVECLVELRFRIPCTPLRFFIEKNF